MRVLLSVTVAIVVLAAPRAGELLLEPPPDRPAITAEEPAGSCWRWHSLWRCCCR